MYDFDEYFNDFKIRVDKKDVSLDGILMVYKILGGRIDTTQDVEKIKGCDDVIEGLGLDHLRHEYLYLSRKVLSPNT